jgi:hypothetical protein
MPTIIDISNLITHSIASPTMNEYDRRLISIPILCVSLAFLLALWAPRIANACHEFSEYILDWHINSYFDRTETLEKGCYAFS